ncbi:MAG: hypothetical protein BWK79_17745 [Beggiatoa sp. IS2]|nr:MAG: hypothetical protein BWK79_17745 [Beggiatoa sp. IS2]
MKFLGQYNGVIGNQAINSTHPIFAGVKALYQNNGNSVVDLEPNNPANQMVLSHANGQGLIAVFEDKSIKAGVAYTVRSKLHGFVLEVQGNNREPRTPIVSGPLNGTGAPNQQWQFVPVSGSAGTYLISSMLNNFVIDITGSNTAPITPVIAYPTNGPSGTPNQQWELVAVPNTENTYLIKTKLNGFVLDIEGSHRTAGARVISYPVNGANGTSNQHWELVPIPKDQNYSSVL